eukprot:3095968-Prymnesium_polylepis.1
MAEQPPKVARGRSESCAEPPQKLARGSGVLELPPATPKAAVASSSSAVVISAEAQAFWDEARGHVLEPYLASGAIALLDAHYLIKAGLKGGVLSCRQELPNEAFVSLAELKANCPEYALPILALSYPWLTARYPDP